MSTENAKPTLYSLQEVADLLGISYSTVRRSMDAGALEVTRLAPRVVRVTPEQIQQWIQDSSTGTTR